MVEPVGNFTHVISYCPRCGVNIGVTAGMVSGIESIICKGTFRTGGVCNGHYYWREKELEFVGTV